MAREVSGKNIKTKHYSEEVEFEAGGGALGVGRWGQQAKC